MPVGPKVPSRKASQEDFTRKVEVTGNRAVVEVRSPTKGYVDEGAAMQHLAAKGEDVGRWEPTGFRSSEWTMANGEQGESTRYTFVHKALPSSAEALDISELIAAIDSRPPVPYTPTGFQRGTGVDHTLVVAIGDMQFGKTDGDGIKGTLNRTIGCIDEAVTRAYQYGDRFNIGHIHIAWLGDHIEGFQSQGGANVWRTQLTLNEQIRLTRRVMLHAMLAFEGMADRLTMAAVPGNHGETARFAGKGVTRYDDSHDTEALIAVADAAALNPARFSHVEFYTPESDEMTVVVDCSGTMVAHAHGHQWNPNKHFEWWKGQAFNKASAMHMADVLMAGHLHHEHIEADGPRTFIGVPAMESESTWWRHKTGTAGAPGLLLMVTSNGQVPIKEMVTSG